MPDLGRRGGGSVSLIGVDVWKNDRPRTKATGSGYAEVCSSNYAPCDYFKAKTLVGEGGGVLSQGEARPEGIYAGRSDVEPPPGNPPLHQIKLLGVDYEQIEKDATALKKRFNEIYQ